MALNSEDKADVKRHLGKAMANKVSKVTRDQKYDSPNRLTGYEKDQLRKKYGTNLLTGWMKDEGRAAKSKAISKKSGERSKYYVGHSNTPHKREVFGSKTNPTKESHPSYGHVRGPFKSKKEAEGTKDYY